MTSELEVLRLVVGRLDAAGLPYMLTGSVALTCYGQPRGTRDLDIVVAVVSGEATRLAKLFAGEFYLDADVVRDAIERRSQFNMIHLEALIKVDMIVLPAEGYFVQAFGRRQRLAADGVECEVIAPEDLVLTKLWWARDTRSEVQLGDVRRVLAGTPDLDRGYLTHWAAVLGVASLLEEVQE